LKLCLSCIASGLWAALQVDFGRHKNPVWEIYDLKCDLYGVQRYLQLDNACIRRRGLGATVKRRGKRRRKGGGAMLVMGFKPTEACAVWCWARSNGNPELKSLEESMGKAIAQGDECCEQFSYTLLDWQRRKDDCLSVDQPMLINIFVWLIICLIQYEASYIGSNESYSILCLQSINHMLDDPSHWVGSGF
jgi:hypothetical protein